MSPALDLFPANSALLLWGTDMGHMLRCSKRERHIFAQRAAAWGTGHGMQAPPLCLCVFM